MSALRTWLRQERAREHADCRALALEILASDLPKKPSFMRVFGEAWREETADLHKHGRDCDLAMGIKILGPPNVRCYYTMCGVEGVW